LFLGLGTTLGYVVQLAAMAVSLRRAGVRITPTWDPGNPAIRQIGRLGAWTAGVVAANMAAYVLIVALASGRAADYTVYTWAFAFFQLPHAIVAVSIMSALMPAMAERWAARDVDEFRRRVLTGLRTTAAVMVPAAAGYALLAHPFIRLVLEHGKVSSAAASTTADVLALFALGLPGFSLYLLTMRAFQAMKDTRTMFFLYLAENAVTVVLAVALYPSLRVQGLAIAFVAPYTVFTVVALVVLDRRVGGLAAAVPPLARIAVAAAGMAAVVAGVVGVVTIDWLELACAGAAGATVYVLLARAMGVDEILTLLRIRRRSA
jgi:putative peptidoglycan lipid II flippase